MWAFGKNHALVGAKLIKSRQRMTNSIHQKQLLLNPVWVMINPIDGVIHLQPDNRASCIAGGLFKTIYVFTLKN